MKEIKPLSQDDPQRTICFCHCVSYAEIVQAIQAGHRTLADVQNETRASTGCGGCECDVLDILEAESSKAPIGAAGGSSGANGG